MRFRMVFIFAFLLVLSGCATQGGKSSAPVQQTVDMAAITYDIPNDSGIANIGLIRCLTFREYSRFVGTGHYERLFIKQIGSNEFTVERRTDNGNFGSGKKYTIKYTIDSSHNGYKIHFKPTSFTSYQQGVFMPFPVPNFPESDLRAWLLDSDIYYHFESNSKYNVDSTYANFLRLLSSRVFEGGIRYPANGKIFKRQFLILYSGHTVYCYLKIYPYHNGSKAVMYLDIPSIETSPNTVNFQLIINGVKKQLLKVLNS